MNDEKQQGCWSLTVKAVMCVMAIIALTWLISGGGSGTLVAIAG